MMLALLILSIVFNVFVFSMFMFAVDKIYWLETELKKKQIQEERL